jgi:hypothetical protein
MWFWGDMEGLDRVLYFDGEIFHTCEWNSVQFFYSWAAAGGSVFTSIVCGGYRGIKLDAECNNGSGSLDRVLSDDTLLFLVRIPNKFDTCLVFSYVLKQFRV